MDSTLVAYAFTAFLVLLQTFISIIRPEQRKSIIFVCITIVIVLAVNVYFQYTENSGRIIENREQAKTIKSQNENIIRLQSQLCKQIDDAADQTQKRNREHGDENYNKLIENQKEHLTSTNILKIAQDMIFQPDELVQLTLTHDKKEFAEIFSRIYIAKERVFIMVDNNVYTTREACTDSLYRHIVPWKCTGEHLAPGIMPY